MDVQTFLPRIYSKRRFERIILFKIFIDFICET